ncbi:class I SAM-dependent methyltransferase [Tardiphaga sp.]|uniref:class I SAM-dependent methyltransferase n=1 Tax=Tardiphaga sp. TaxID=1926292 RepID=UPI00352B462B
MRPNFWTTGEIAPVSYPGEAHAALAKVEEASFWFRHRNKVIGSAVERFSKGKTVFELGGGNGFVSLGLERRGIQTVVVEPGIDGANVAAMRGLTVVHAAFTPDLFAAGSLPAVGLFDVIEHIADDREFLAGCAAAMEPGGYIYIAVPAHQFLWSADDEYAGHYRRYGRSQLIEILRSAGFDVLQATAFFTLLVPPLFALRTIPSKFKWRSVASTDDAFDHHTEGFGARMIEKMLGLELPIILRGGVLPFGTSFLAIGKKASR